MTPQRTGRLVLLALACALGSYLATYAFQQPGSNIQETRTSLASVESLSQWLRLSPPQAEALHDIELDFAAEIKPLEAKLATEREKLAALFESMSASNEAILQQVENVIAAHNDVERAVAKHLVEMRPHLTPQQQKRLFDHFADSVRECGGRQWRHGRPDHAGGERRGGGPPPGRGPRHGQSSRGGRGN